MHGQLVPEGARTEVTWVVSGSSVCSSVFVGPRVVLTAAHCLEEGGTAIALDRGRRLYGKGYRIPEYASRDVDLGVVILSRPRDKGPYATVSMRLQEGERVDLFGQGCPEVGVPSDGKFRRGISKVVGFDDYDFQMWMEDGAVACFGDSGGPVFRREEIGEGMELVGIISKGDILETTYAVNLGNSVAVRFLSAQAMSDVQICGLNVQCPSLALEPPAWTLPISFPPFRFD